MIDYNSINESQIGWTSGYLTEAEIRSLLRDVFSTQAAQNSHGLNLGTSDLKSIQANMPS